MKQADDDEDDQSEDERKPKAVRKEDADEHPDVSVNREEDGEEEEDDDDVDPPEIDRKAPPPASSITRTARSTTSDNKNGPQDVIATDERTPDDVLCGRGIPFQKWPGNQRMRRIVQKHRQEYATAKRHEKGVIVQRVIQEIKDGGARFLHPLVEDDGQEEVEQWVEAKNEYVYEKVSHAMRQKKRRPGASTTSSMSSSSQRRGSSGSSSNNNNNNSSSSNNKAGGGKSGAASAQINQMGSPTAARFFDARAVGDSSSLLTGTAGMTGSLAAGIGALPVVDASLLNLLSSSTPGVSTNQQDFFSSSSTADLAALAGSGDFQRLLRIEQLRRQQLNIQMMRREELLLQLQIEQLQRQNASGISTGQPPSATIQSLVMNGLLQQQHFPSNLSTVTSNTGGDNVSLPNDIQGLQRQMLEGSLTGFPAAHSGVDRGTELRQLLSAQATAPVRNTATAETPRGAAHSEASAAAHLPSSLAASQQQAGLLSGLSERQLQLLRLLELEQQQQQQRGGGS